MDTNRSTFIIAEAGVNHNGDMGIARQLIDVAADARADAVKFQTFAADRLASPGAPKADYQTRTSGEGESQLEMLRRLELSETDHQMLIAHARQRDIAFLSSPFDAQSLHLLTDRFGLTTIKVPSGEITNAPFLLAVSRASRAVILSTGMSTLEEVEAALGVLAFGFTDAETTVPRRTDFARAFASPAGRRQLCDRVTLLHCTSEYPAPYGEVNLSAMATMASAFGVPVGYSDHTPGIHVSLAAVALGARMIEKHFTLDRSMWGPDHAASLEPGELRELVSRAREIESALGDGIKRPTASELKNRDVARKSLVATESILAGQVFTEDNLTSKRPGTGMSPFEYWDVLGEASSRDYGTDESLYG
jgi:N-acetylneuraminate synthase